MSDEAPSPSPKLDSVIPYARQCIDETDIQAVVSALRSDYVTQGPRIVAFEDGLREATGARYAVAVSSGTAALHLSCLGLDLRESHFGVLPAITFASTANCLRHSGSDVAFCDVDPRSGLATVDAFRTAIESFVGPQELGALLPVSFSGAVPDLEAIARLAAEKGAYVIEDAAHSMAATYRTSDGSTSRSASCSHSDAAILSFHPVKHVCAGEGGAVLTNDETLARRLRRLRSHGIEKGEAWTYNQIELGYHYRLTELQAALGASQLEKLDGFVDRRRVLAARYAAAFEQEPFRSRIRMSNRDEGSSWHLFVIHFADEGERRAAYDFLHARNIRAQVHYMPVYRHDYYRKVGHASLPGAEAFYRTCLSLPLYPKLEDEQQDRVIAALEAFLERREQ